MEGQQLANDLKAHLTSLQGNHKETLDQLGEKSKQVVVLKTELDRVGHQNLAMSEEVLVAIYILTRCMKAIVRWLVISAISQYVF